MILFPCCYQISCKNCACNSNANNPLSNNITNRRSNILNNNPFNFMINANFRVENEERNDVFNPFRANENINNNFHFPEEDSQIFQLQPFQLNLIRNLIEDDGEGIQILNNLINNNELLL